MRYRARTDANMREVTDALKRCGVFVRYIKYPFDLIAFNLRTREWFFVEVKTENGTLTASQREWISSWPGKILIVRSAEDAVRQILGAEVMA